MSRLLVRNGVFSRGPFRGGLGEDAAVPAAVAPSPVDTLLATLDARTKQITKQLDDDARARKYALMIGAASALFAAVKLGLIAFPHIKARVKSTP